MLHDTSESAVAGGRVEVERRVVVEREGRRCRCWSGLEVAYLESHSRRGSGAGHARRSFLSEVRSEARPEARPESILEVRDANEKDERNCMAESPFYR